MLLDWEDPVVGTGGMFFLFFLFYLDRGELTVWEVCGRGGRWVGAEDSGG